MFSSLDACGVYHAVRIEPGSRACTAYISLLGTFQYIRMSFGLANPERVFSRMLDVAMKDVDRDFWTFYLDDILTFSREPWAHLGNLAHAAAGIKIQLCKTMLFQSEVEYLGHKISKGRVSMIPEYVQKIKDWPVLMFIKAANRNQTREVGQICLPASMVKELWSLWNGVCHSGPEYICHP